VSDRGGRGSFFSLKNKEKSVKQRKAVFYHVFIINEKKVVMNLSFRRGTFTHRLIGPQEGKVPYRGVRGGE